MSIINFTDNIWSYVFLFLLFYLYHGIGITLGYHRLLSHKSIELPKWLTYFIVLGGYLSFMGSPIVWVAIHRLHHQQTDLAKDPHSPKHGYLHSFMGWMFHISKYQTDVEIKSQTKDLCQDPVWNFLGTSNSYHQGLLCLFFTVLYRVLLFIVGGLNLVIINLLACTMVFISTQMVNVICHKPGLGYKNYPTKDDSSNVWWVGLLALGEGWHNNHHWTPKRARHGIKWYEFDFTYLTMLVLAKIGLAKAIFTTEKNSSL